MCVCVVCGVCGREREREREINEMLNILMIKWSERKLKVRNVQ